MVLPIESNWSEDSKYSITLPKHKLVKWTVKGAKKALFKVMHSLPCFVFIVPMKGEKWLNKILNGADHFEWADMNTLNSIEVLHCTELVIGP